MSRDENHKPTVLISLQIVENDRAMIALREAIEERTHSRAFLPIVMLRSFGDIHDATAEYAHDAELYRKQASEIFACSTTLDAQIEAHLGSIGYIALTCGEWEDATEARQFLTRYLQPAVVAATRAQCNILAWDETKSKWETLSLS